MTIAFATRQSSQLDTSRGSRMATASSERGAIRQAPIADAADASEAELEQIGTVVMLPRGRTVLEEGDPANYVFKVVSGALRSVRLLTDGRRSIINFLLPGDFFGFTDTGHYTQSVEILADATLIRYPRRRFEALLESDPRAGCRFFNLICAQLSVAQDRLLLLGRKSALERVATFLLTMIDRRASRGKGNDVDLPMNRVDVADYLGLTIETVSRVLSQLRSRRIIDLPTASHVVLLDRAALAEISDCEIPAFAA
ncbi:MAG: helix-turn-helix domain-containing protein [Proteobacteria bacterium]|nr:helix-turn-helix domain-containing protein [Pseudomonadota bacterium]